MSRSNSKPNVAVVLCTYNGALHIDQQLQSLEDQTWPIHVLVFDDGSSDNTIKLIESYKDNLNLTVRSNTKNLGFVSNFEHSIQTALQSKFEYIALCDQDDIWAADKVEQEMHAILEAERKFGKQERVLVHSDLRLIDEHSNEIHNSFFAYRGYTVGKEKSLALILGQTGVMGNTILMNSALAKFALPFPNNLHMHDYWLAVLTELYGHRILLEHPLVNYRIHANNVSNTAESIALSKKSRTLSSRLKFVRTWFSRDHKLPYLEDNRLETISFLANNQERFAAPSDVEQNTLSTFIRYLEFKGSPIKRYYSMAKGGFFKAGIRHQISVAYRFLLTNRYDDR